MQNTTIPWPSHNSTTTQLHGGLQGMKRVLEMTQQLGINKPTSSKQHASQQPLLALLRERDEQECMLQNVRKEYNHWKEQLEFFDLLFDQEQVQRLQILAQLIDSLKQTCVHKTALYSRIRQQLAQGQCHMTIQQEHQQEFAALLDTCVTSLQQAQQFSNLISFAQGAVEKQQLAETLHVIPVVLAQFVKFVQAQKNLRTLLSSCL